MLQWHAVTLSANDQRTLAAWAEDRARVRARAGVCSAARDTPELKVA